jgi:hypothetical protein
MTDRDAHAIACHSVQIQAQQNVADVSHIIGEANDEHRDAGKTGNLTHVLDT